MDRILILRNNTVEIGDLGRVLTFPYESAEDKNTAVINHIFMLTAQYGVNTYYDGFNVRLWYHDEDFALVVSRAFMPAEVDQDVMWYARMGGAWVHQVYNEEEDIMVGSGGSIDYSVEGTSEYVDNWAEKEDITLLPRTYRVH